MSRSIPSMKVNNYTNIFTQPIFKNQNGEWYRDVGYIDSLDIIRENFQGAAKSFIGIGYYLKHIKDRELFREGGYATIWDCAQAEFGLSQTAASRFMSMNDAFSVNGNTPLLDEKYNDFNKSQLQEMLALPEEKREEIKAEQTVSEIRQIVQKEKRTKEPPEEDVRSFYEIYVAKCDKDRSRLKELLIKALGKTHAGGNSIGFDFQCSPRGVKLRNADEITWAQLVKMINLYFPVPAVIDKTAKETGTAAHKSQDGKEQAEEEPLQDELQKDEPDELLEEPQLPGQMNFADYPVLEDRENETAGSEPVIYDARFFLEEQKKKLEECLRAADIPEIVLCRQKIIVAALAAMVCEIEENAFQTVK